VQGSKLTCNACSYSSIVVCLGLARKFLECAENSDDKRSCDSEFSFYIDKTATNEQQRNRAKENAHSVTNEVASLTEADRTE
jgi:hypothetical protein